MLLASLALYCGIYYRAQGMLPGDFELTTTVNNTMPLVLAAIAQTLVVLTRGIDLSVGGVIDLDQRRGRDRTRRQRRQHRAVRRAACC